MSSAPYGNSPFTTANNLVQIDPEAVTAAGLTLTSTVNQLDFIGHDIQNSLARAGIDSPVRSQIIDADYELSTLNEILQSRAELAQGFRILGLMERQLSANVISELWDHLTDPEGDGVQVAGDQAALLVLDQFSNGDADYNGRLSDGELSELAEHGTNRAVRQAASYILNHADYRDEISGRSDKEITFDDLDHFITINSEIRAAASLATLLQVAGGKQPDFELTDGQKFSPAELLVAAINRHVFVDEPDQSRGFIASLPTAALDQPTLNQGNISGEALKALHQSALNGVPADDRWAQFEILAHLPESKDGYRNGQISYEYASLALIMDSLLNGYDTEFSSPNSTGANWLHFGASASFSVGPTIRGEQSSYTVDVPPVIRHAFADGNQTIFASITPHYLRFIDAFAEGEVTSEATIDYLAHFADGEDELRTAFAAQLGVATSDNPERRRQSQYVANLMIGLHEQALINDNLNMNQLSTLEQAGAHLGSGFFNELKNPSMYFVNAIVGSRSAAQIATDDGKLTMPMRRDDDGKISGPSVSIGDDLPENPKPDPSVAELDLAGEYNPVDLSVDQFGLPLTGAELDDLASSTQDRPFNTDYDDWLTHDSDIKVDDWTTYEDRIKFIAELMRNNQFNPELAESARFQASTPQR